LELSLSNLKMRLIVKNLFEEQKYSFDKKIKKAFKGSKRMAKTRPVNEPTHSTGSLELGSIKFGSKSSSILFSSARYCTSSLD
jgi:hypothetical protein